MSNVLAHGRPRRSSKSACDPTDDECGVGDPRRPLVTLEDYVAHYIERVRPMHDAERARYARLPTLDEAIRVSALSIDDRGKRLCHQRRIPGAVLERVAKRLRHDGLRGIASFDELYDRIIELCGNIEKFGELTRYDVTVRIGARLKLEPQRVYLHCGTRAGAKELGVAHRAATVEMDKLPRALRKLRPAEVEDFLCIYKDELGRFRDTW